MSEQLFLTDTRASGAFLPLVLFGFSLMLMLGFEMIDEIGQRSRLQTVLAQREPDYQKSLQLQNRLQTLLVSFNKVAPEEAKTLFEKLGIRFTPSAKAPVVQGAAPAP